MDGADAVFIAVGTPTRRGDGHADLTYVMAAAEEIGRALTGYAVVVTKSTVPVGTNRKVAEVIRAANPEAEFDVASNPEFLREGAAIDDFMRPDRVVVGVETERREEGDGRPLPPAVPARVSDGLHRAGKRRDDQIRGQRVSGDQDHLHQRNRRPVRKGGRGCEGGGQGHRAWTAGSATSSCMRGRAMAAVCFPKDTKALARIGQEHAVPMQIVETVIKVNDEVKRRMIDKIVDLCDGAVRDKTIAVLGVTFKPNTDDMRDAPSPDHRAGAGGGGGEGAASAIRRAGTRARRCCPASNGSTTPIRRRRAPIWW